MSFQGELITFSLPANELILKFLQMKQSQQMKSIELGMQFLTVGNKQLQGWNNEEWKIIKHLKENCKDIVFVAWGGFCAQDTS